MSEWRDVVFGELGELYDGPHATPTRRTEGPYFLNISSLKSGRLDLEECDHVSDEDFTRWTRRITPRHNDLLFSYETRLGEAALMPKGVDACLGRRMALLRPDPTVVHPRFLLYYYLGPEFQKLIASRTVHGATVSRISLSTLPSWTVRIPSLAAQCAIGEILGSFDEKIESNDRVVSAADSLAVALLGESESSQRVPLSSIAAVTMGSSPPGVTYNDAGRGLPFYQGVRDFGFRFPARRVWTTAPARTAEPSETLVSVRAPVGDVNRSREKICLGRGLASLRSTVQAPMTLFHQLRSEEKAWFPYEAEGTVFGAINRAQLEAIQLPLIDEARAVGLEVRLTALEAHIDVVISENARLVRTRDELLPLLMSGKVSVREADRMASEVL